MIKRVFAVVLLFLSLQLQIASQERPMRIVVTTADGLQSAIDKIACGGTIAIQNDLILNPHNILRDQDRAGELPCTTDSIIRREGPLPGPFNVSANCVQVGPNFEAEMAKRDDCWQKMRDHYGKGAPKIFVETINAQQGNAWAMYSDCNANHWRIQGIEIGSRSNVFDPPVYGLVFLGGNCEGQGFGYFKNREQIGHHITFEQIWCHGLTTSITKRPDGEPASSTRRCILANADHFTFKDSLLDDFAEIGQDSQAIMVYNAYGPFTFDNLFTDAAGENIMFGGADPSRELPGLVPCDIDISNSYHTKNWNRWDHGSWAGYANSPFNYQTKNSFELKNACRVRAWGNVFEASWAYNQSGSIMLHQSMNQDGTCPQCVVQDVDQWSNIVRWGATALTFAGKSGQGGGSSMGHNQIFRDSLAYGLLSYFGVPSADGTKGGNGGTTFAFTSGNSGGATHEPQSGIHVLRNTIAMADGQAAVINNCGDTFTNFKLNDNLLIAAHDWYDVQIVLCGSAGGKTGFDLYMPGTNGYEIERNVIGTAGNHAAPWPPSNAFMPVATYAGLFVDYANMNFRLKADSPYKGVGADFTKLPGIGSPVPPGPITPPPPPMPPCLINTSTQRTIWNRMKAENEDGYQQVSKNVTWERYNDLGRWELQKALFDNDPAMFQKSFLELKTALSDFTNVFTGNESREYAIELPVMYGCMYPSLTDTQRTEFRTYILKVGDGIVKMLRLGDSDQTTGNVLGLLLMDKVLGTTYGSGAFFDGNVLKALGGFNVTDCKIETSGRDAVCNFAKVMGAGGAWPEGTAYNGGTLWLYLSGIQWLGVDNFPEAKPFIRELAKYLVHEHMPGLKNRYEFGDTEHPNEMILIHGPLDVWQVLQSLLDEIGEPQLASYIRQFEVDILAANGQTTAAPLYARYYYRHNPYGVKADWRAWAGLSQTSSGQGLTNWRTGWTTGDRGTYLHAPGVSNGIVDHWQAFEFDIRHFRKGATAIDHPLGYQPDRRFFNTLLVRDSGMSAEAGGLIGSAFQAGVVGYASGFNAGVGQDVYETYSIAVPTVQHGQFRSVFEPLDGGSDSPSVQLVVDTLNAEDVLTVTAPGWMNDPPIGVDGLYYKNVADRFKRAKPITFYWHTPVTPTINGGVISWSVGTTKMAISQVSTSVPLTPVVVNETTGHCNASPTDPGCLGGYMQPAQLKWQVRMSSETLPRYSTFVHCLSALETGAVTCEPLRSTTGAPVVGGVIKRTGLPAVSFLSSAVQGPKLVTTVTPEGRVRWDHTKGTIAVAGSRVCDAFTFNAVGGDVYIADLCTAKAWEVVQNSSVLPTTQVGSLLRVTPAAGAVRVQVVGSTPPPPCTYSLSPGQVNIGAAGGMAQFAFTPSATTCTATPTSSETWATPVPGTPWQFSVLANPLSIQRSAYISVGSVASLLIQAGAVVVPPPPPPPICETLYRTVTITGTGTNAQWTTAIAAQKKEGYEPLFAIAATRAVFVKRCPIN